LPFAPVPPEYLRVPIPLAAAPPAAPAPVAVELPPLAPAMTADPAIEAQFVVALQK
jgi:hypothetical protein